jgi:hypothetical protein
MRPGDFDVPPGSAAANAAADISWLLVASPQPAGTLPVSIRPQSYQPAADFATMPKPFTWRESGPLDGGIGAVYSADNQLDQDGYGVVWTDLGGWKYEKFFVSQYSFRIPKWRRIA